MYQADGRDADRRLHLLALKVLVVGSEGASTPSSVRCAVRRASRRCSALGNVGIARDARVVDVGVEDVPGMVGLARAPSSVDLVVVGPEVPLVKGLVDALQDDGITAFVERAPLPGSRAPRHSPRRSWRPRVPTARYEAVTTVEDGMAAIDRVANDGYPVVLKYDGLAAGKGVVIAENAQIARDTLHEFLVEGRFGGEQVVVEEHLVGTELSRWRCATASARSRWRSRRTTSGSSRATRGRTPAAWARTRRCPAPTTSRRSPARCTSRSSTCCASAACRSTASCTPG